MTAVYFACVLAGLSPLLLAAALSIGAARRPVSVRIARTPSENAARQR